MGGTKGECVKQEMRWVVEVLVWLMLCMSGYKEDGA